MGSDVNGKIVVPVWSDDGVVKPVIDDNGRIQVTVGETTITIDINLKSSDITLDVEEQSPLTTIQTHPQAYVAAAWQKQPIIWSVTGKYTDNWDSIATGTNISIFSATVPYGRWCMIQSIAVRDITNGPVNVNIQLRDDGVLFTSLLDETALVQWKWAIYNGGIILGGGDTIEVNVVNCVIGDAIKARMWGYMMRNNL